MNKVTISTNLILIFFCLLLNYSAKSTSITTIKSGNWDDPTVWSTGFVPRFINPNFDAVTIASGHNITASGDYKGCDSLIINGFLDVGSVNLTIGGRELFIDVRVHRNSTCIINGGLRINGDFNHQFKVYGDVKFNAGSTFEMTAGLMMIDGCGFIESESVTADKALLDVTNAATFSQTGGLIVLFNPHFHPNGLSVKGAKAFQNISFGNNVTLSNFAARSQSDFLVSNVEKPTFDVVQLAYLPHPNYQNKVVLNNHTIGSLALSSGVVTGLGRLKVAGNVLIGANGGIETDIELNGQEQNIVAYNGNGTATTIKGNMFINVMNRVTTYLDLTIQNGTLQFIKGKLDVTNKTLTLNSPPLGATETSYCITNDYNFNLGSLLIKNLSGSTVFPVGTESAYLPVTLTTTSGDFSVAAHPLSISPPSGYFGLNNQWLVNRVNGTAAADVQVQWRANSENTAFATYRNNSGLYRQNNAAWEFVGAGSGAAYVKSVQNVQNFSPFTVLTSATPIPVELTKFGGRVQNSVAQLDWATASERNTKSFDVEKSSDGVQFSPIGFVKSVGFSAKNNDYTFIDALFEATSYYRLKQIDTDNQYVYSKTITLEKNKSNKSYLQIYPNPMTHQSYLTVDFSEDFKDNIALGIFDMYGHLVYQKRDLKSNFCQILVENWAKGMYIVQLTDGILMTQTRFAKQ